MIRMRLAIQQRQISFYEAFTLFDCAGVSMGLEKEKESMDHKTEHSNSSEVHKSGMLGPGELWAGLEWLGLTVSEEDIVGLMITSDADGDRNLCWQDFAGMVNYADEELSELDKALINSGRLRLHEPVVLDEVTLVAKDNKTLMDLWKSMDQDAARQEQQAEQKALDEERARQAELALEEEEERKRLGIAANPLIENNAVHYDFTTSTMPKNISVFGYVEFRASFGKSVLFVDSKTFLVLPVHKYAPFIDQPGPRVNSYSVVMDVSFAKMPVNLLSLFRTGTPVDAKAAEVNMANTGDMGIGMFISSSRKIRRNNRSHVALCVDMIAGLLTIYLDGEQVTQLNAEMLPDLGFDGKMSFDRKTGGICLFASETDSYMQGGTLTRVSVFNECLDAFQVNQLVAIRTTLDSWTCGFCGVVNPDRSGICSCCEQRRPVQESKNGVKKQKEIDPNHQTLLDMGLETTEERFLELLSQVGPDVMRMADLEMQRRFG
jgi:hypothetical protein